MLPAKLRYGDTAFRLAQHSHDLGFGKSALLHHNLLEHLAEKILLLKPLICGEDYQREKRDCLFVANHARIDPVGNGNLDHFDPIGIGTTDDAITSNQGATVNLAAAAIRQVDHLDGGVGQAVQSSLEILIGLSAIRTAAEFQDMRGAGPIGLRRKTWSQPLVFIPAITLHLVRQIRHHVEKDIVVENGRKARLGAAFDCDQAVFQLITDDAGICPFAERERCHIHQVDIILDWRVVDGRDEERELCICRRCRTQDALWFAFLHQDRRYIGLQRFVANGFTEVTNGPIDGVIFQLVQL